MERWGVNSVNNLHLQRIHSWPRAIALHCLLTQAKPSIVLSYTHESRADALYCLLTQAIRSLMARKKQMSAPQPLVFFFAHYTCFHSEQQVTVHRLHDQQRNFFSYS